MVYVKLNNKECRLGNWMLDYASAISQRPNDPVTFIITHKPLKEDHDPRKRSELWPDAKYEFCDAKNCAECGKCIPLDRRCGTFNQKVVQERIICPERIRKEIEQKWGDKLHDMVSIGVRRGDYLWLPHTHPFVGKDYLRKAVAKFPEGTTFIVTSDDIPWCKRFFAERHFPGMKFVFSEGASALTDMFLSMFCKHNIISNSTFNWWGAYLNKNPNRRVISPMIWQGIASHADPFRRDKIFEGMEIIDNKHGLAHHYWAILFWTAHSLIAGVRKHIPGGRRVMSYLLHFIKH